jgi:hypothetical protein
LTFRKISIAILSKNTSPGILEKLADGQQNHGARPNAIKGRPAIIEKHTGLMKA